MTLNSVIILNYECIIAGTFPLKDIETVAGIANHECSFKMAFINLKSDYYHYHNAECWQISSSNVINYNYSQNNCAFNHAVILDQIQ